VRQNAQGLRISPDGAMRLTLDMKNDEVIDTPLPAWLADLVATYLATHRTVLLDQNVLDMPHLRVIF